MASKRSYWRQFVHPILFVSLFFTRKVLAVSTLQADVAESDDLNNITKRYMLNYAGPLLRSPDDPPFTEIVQFGDSYSAAPGAGEWLGDQQIPPPPSTLPSCYRLNGGYASHLISNDYIKLSNPAGAGDPPTLKAVACSGYTSPTILKEQVNKLQLPFAADRLALLSTGGNDLGFSTIARACFTPLFGKCNVEVDNGRTALYANEFSNNFRDLLRGILDKPRFFCPQQTARSCNTAIYQTSYPSFFSENSTFCNSQNWVATADKFTRAFRANINQLVQELNVYLSFLVDEVNYERRIARSIDPVKFVDQGSVYSNHRICSRSEPAYQDQDTWFFEIRSKRENGRGEIEEPGPEVTPTDYTNIDPKTCISDGNSSDPASQWACAISQELAAGLIEPDELPPPAPQWLTKILHPRWNAYKATSDYLVENVLKFRHHSPAFAPPTDPIFCGSITSQRLRILTIGDSLTHGFTGETPDGEGYRRRLWDAFTQKGAEDTSYHCRANSVEFIGTQGYNLNGDSPYACNEGYNGKSIAEIRDKVRATEIVRRGGANVIILMAGTNDFLDNQSRDPEKAAGALDAFIGEIFDQKPDATLIVSHVPWHGNAGFDPSLQRNRWYFEYNARINRIVDERRFMNPTQRIYKAYTHVDPVAEEHAPDDAIHPSNEYGYPRMADGIYEALFVALQERPISVPREEPPWEFSHCSDGSRGIIGSDAGAEKPGNCSFPKRASPYHDFCPSTPIYSDNGIVGDGGGLGPNLFGQITCISTPGNGRPVCQCTKHDDMNNPTGGNQSVWDAAFVDEIGGNCSEMNLNWTTAVRMADIDGDGDLDYLFVNRDSSVLGFENIGSSGNQAHVGYKYHERIAKGVPGHEGIAYDFRHEIQFADLNGDGLADYIRTWPNGKVEAWFNAGSGWCNLDSSGWTHQGIVATGIGRPGNGVRHVDLNGDGRADYVYVARDGSTIVWMNVADANFPGGIRYVNNGQVHGPTGNSVSREGIQFADVTGKGTPDYLMVEPNGRTTMDYNGGPVSNENTCNRNFLSHGEIASGAGRDFEVMYADLNGDSRAEYNVISPDKSSIHAFYPNCPAANGNSLFCRNGPGGNRKPVIQDAAQTFCRTFSGSSVGYNTRAQKDGNGLSFTALCNTCGPNNKVNIGLEEQTCINAFDRIVDGCGDQMAGSFVTDDLEYILYRF